jgi:hypothetical protein
VGTRLACPGGYTLRAMTITTEIVLIGGPRDGTRVQIPDPVAHFTYLVPDPLGHAPFTEAEPDVSIPTRHLIYRIRYVDGWPSLTEDGAYRYDYQGLS